MKCINNLSFNDCADHCACLFIDADAATASPAALSWGSDSGGETCVEDYDDDGDDIYEAYGDGDGWSWGVIDGDQVEYLDDISELDIGLSCTAEEDERLRDLEARYRRYGAGDPVVLRMLRQGSDVYQSDEEDMLSDDDDKTLDDEHEQRDALDSDAEMDYAKLCARLEALVMPESRPEMLRQVPFVAV